MEQKQKQKLILQLYIPFCYRHCAHCRLFRCRYDASVLEAHIRAMEREIEASADELQDFEITAVSLEGGSPGLAAPASLQRLLRTVRRNLPLSENVQISVQTMPGEYSRALMQKLRDCGVNFWSIGMDTAEAQEHFLLERPYDFNALTMVDAAVKNFNLRDLSFELIYGIPGQTRHSWMHTLKSALYYAPEHMTLLPFTVEPGTGVYQKIQSGGLKESPAQQCAAFYEMAKEYLISLGYCAYTVWDFAREGKENRFRLEQLRGTGQLGLGYGSHTWMDGVSYVSGHSLREYLEHSGELAVIADHLYRPQGAALMQKRLRQALRLSEGADLPALAKECGADVSLWETQLMQLHGKKEADCREGRWYLTGAGIARAGLPYEI